MELNGTNSMMGMDSSIDITHRVSGSLAWRYRPTWPYNTASTAARVRPKSVEERMLSVPILGSIVPEKGTIGKPNSHLKVQLAHWTARFFGGLESSCRAGGRDK